MSASDPSPTRARAPEKSVLREYVEALVWALVLALFIRTFFVQAFKIPSGSMKPTLQIGDHLLVNKVLYGLRIPRFAPLVGVSVPYGGTRFFAFEEPERGDVIVFEFPRPQHGEVPKDFIKRVVGVPGDVIEVRHRRLYRNGRLVPREAEPYARWDPRARETPGPRDNFGPVTVPPRHVFVMGDNRDHSFDSRFWGFVPYENIKGKAFVIYWSWDGEHTWVRWSRLGSAVR